MEIWRELLSNPKHWQPCRANEHTKRFVPAASRDLCIARTGLRSKKSFTMSTTMRAAFIRLRRLSCLTKSGEPI